MNLPTRKEVIKQVRSKGMKIAAVLPIHYPRALLRAFGFHPMEVWGPPGINTHAEASHFQEYCCAIVRNATSFLRSAGGRDADCILVPHTCDSLQGMGSLFLSSMPDVKPVLTVYHPRGRGESHIRFLRQDLLELAEKLRLLSDADPSDADITAALEIEIEADRMFGHMCHHRGDYSLGDRDFYTALRSREFLPAEWFLETARSLPHGGGHPDGLSLLMSGIVPEPMEIFDHINHMGAWIAADDLACCGRRVYGTFDDPDPFRRMALQLTSMPPDPTTGASVKERCDHLVALADRSSVKGVVVYNVKFCEPELFFQPFQRAAIEASGRTVLYLEGDLSRTVSYQIVNRIQSFLETLG